MSFLAKRTLVVSGASMGVGRALAEELARLGVKLVLNARGKDKLGEVADICRSRGVAVECVAGDASKSRIAREMVARAEGMGNFFGFLHVAGVLNPGNSLWEMSEERFQEVFHSNVAAAFQMVRAAVPVLRKKGGGLAVFFGSGAAEITQPGIAAYCAAKAAEEHLARQLAAEAPPVTTVIWRPGVVETRMQHEARQATGGAAEQLRQVFTAWKTQGMLITPEQSARGLVRFLLGNPRAYHGQVADIRNL